jgi:hypothetical protein
VTGRIYDFLLRISRIVRESPFGIVNRKPDPNSKSAGICESSEYWQSDPEIAVNVMKAGIGGPPSGSKSLTMCKPESRVELLTKPVSFAFIEPSAETNQAKTGMRSVTNRCISRSASSCEIMLSLMEKNATRQKRTIGVTASASNHSAANYTAGSSFRLSMSATNRSNAV